ncbi:MAG TPA: bifunctional serine/threonine-protein kinase/formylglycine-generating enzyme family protein [Anaerolineales bacterium]|nr:bifunctional serine/threonine-protein kinase/formylglycine-generating enzyme family protein [Anaerolineales bacterium]
MPEWIGKTIGNVRIDKLLARGGMAEVYLGLHRNLDRLVAIKLLHSYIEEEPLLIERFHREAKVVAGLRHPNIVQIFDFDTVDGHPFIVMEYLKGPTLATYLRHLHQRKKRIPPDQVARLLKEISVALDYAHKQGVIHRDIKPGNIILHNKTEDITVDKPLTNDVEAIITDFGLVRIMNTASQTASGMVSGTPAYMSPEQARGDQTDHRTDIYSLGVVLYEMLAGRVPFEADSTLTVLHMQIHTTPPPIAGIHANVQQVIDRALVKNPDERYQTSRELAMDYYRSIGMTPQAATIQEAHPVRAAPSDASQSQPIELRQVTEEKPQTKSEAVPKPTRSRTWIGVGIFSLVCITLLAIGGYRLLSAGPILPNSTETLSPEIPNTSISPLPSEAPSLPEATEMVKVDAGTYEVGKDPADNYHTAPQSIALNEFWIDQYQTTNAEYEQYLTATGAPTPLVWPSEQNHPVRGVTWDQALAYCGWLNKRLPSEAEWEAAGRGPGSDPQLYPWGDDPTDGGNALQLPNQNTYEIGSQPFNVSPLQLYDMVGNVWEWVGEPYRDLSPGTKILRGGRFSNAVDLAYRLPVPSDDTNTVQYAGFRCAADQVR